MHAGLLPRLHERSTAPQAHAGAIDIGTTSLISRSVTGVSLPLRLEAAGQDLGTVRVIGGVGNAGALGALTWQTGGAEGPGIGVGILRTGLPAAPGGGLLTQTSLRLPLPFLDNAPTLGLAFASYAGDANQGGGTAGRLSFAADLFGGRYSLSYAQAQSGFRPLGSPLIANQTSLDLSAHYTLGQYQLSQRLRFRQAHPDQPDEIRTWRSDTFWQGPVADALPLLNTLRLHAGLWLRRGLNRHPDNTGWLVEAHGQGMAWQTWRFETRLALKRGAAPAPVSRVNWRLGAVRSIDLAAFGGHLATLFGVGLNTTAPARWQWRSSVRVQMQHDAQQLSFGIHWASNGWRDNAPGQASWRFMFRYSIAAEDALPRLASAFGKLVPDL